jgi:hypothetical protein
MVLLFLLQIGIPLGEKHFARCCRNPSCFLYTLLDVPGINLSQKKSFFILSRDHLSGVANDLTVYGVERHDFSDCYALVLPPLPFQLSSTAVSPPILAIPIGINSSL